MVKKNIIVVAAGPFQFAMINPVITRKSGAFETEEGCLSLDGVRSVSYTHLIPAMGTQPYGFMVSYSKKIKELVSIPVSVVCLLYTSRCV